MYSISWGYSGSPSTRRLLREKVAEVGRNSINLENQEATLVPRLYDTYPEKGLWITFKVLY